MDKYRKLAELLKNRSTKDVFFTAKFISSQGSTCTILVDDLELDEVRLLPTTAKSDNKVLLTPKVGTDVLIGSLSGDLNNLFIISANEIQDIEITCSEVNLMELISDFIQTIAQAKVITPQGTGTFDPSVISQLNVIETKFKQVLK